MNERENKKTVLISLLLTLNEEEIEELKNMYPSIKKLIYLLT